MTTEGYLPNNPAQQIKLLKTDKDTIESFNESQVRALLSQPDQRTYTGFRDYVLMVLMLDTGIRVSEALGLTVTDFNYEQKIVVVPARITKNHQSRVLPLTKHTAKAIHDLLKENLQFENKPQRIFVTNYGEPQDPSTVRHRIKDYGTQANITGVRVSPHTFRHTFAKFYILNGGDAFTLQRLLDHSTVKIWYANIFK